MRGFKFQRCGAHIRKPSLGAQRGPNVADTIRRSACADTAFTKIIFPLPPVFSYTLFSPGVISPVIRCALFSPLITWKSCASGYNIRGIR